MNSPSLFERLSGVLAYLLPVAVMVLLTACSSTGHLPGAFFISHLGDKLVHFVVFGGLALLIARLPWVQERLPLGAYSAVVIVAIFGFFDEVHQSFVPGRSPDPFDWLADLAGALAFVSVYVHRERLLPLLQWLFGLLPRLARLLALP